MTQQRIAQIRTMQVVIVTARACHRTVGAGNVGGTTGRTAFISAFPFHLFAELVFADQMLCSAVRIIEAFTGTIAGDFLACFRYACHVRFGLALEIIAARILERRHGPAARSGI